MSTVQLCTKFQTSRPHSSRKKCDEKFPCWKLERKKNEEIRGQISSSSLFPVYTIYLPTVHVCTKFRSSRPHSSPKKCDEKFQCWKLERKKNEEIKGQISSSSLIPVNIIHLPTVHVCTKFQSSRPHSSREKCDEKFQCWKLQRKKNEEIMGQISSSNLIPVYYPSFNLLGLTVPEKSVTKNSNVWKVNWTWRFHNMSNENFIRPQGQVTPKWLIRSSQNSNSSEILCLSWLPASLRKIQSIRAVAGLRSSPESGFANKTKMFFGAKKIKEEKSLDHEISVTVT